MKENKILFQGVANVYLQGHNALQVNSSINPEKEMQYYIGNEQSKLVIRDHRKNTIKEARQAIQFQYQNGFAKNFNRSAWVKVLYDIRSEKIEIDIRRAAKENLKSPVLWMGVLENNLMPGYEVAWEVFRTIGSKQTAFVALIS